MNLPSKLLLAVTLSMLVSPSLQFVDPTSDTVQFGGLSMHKPGLKVRVTQAFS